MQAYLVKAEKAEESKYTEGFRQQFMKKRNILLQRHKKEIQTLRIRIQKPLNQKLRMREQEVRALLQRFENLKNELRLK